MIDNCIPGSMADSNDELHINDLPSGLLHAIFDFLSPKDLCSASATCKQWRCLNQDAAADQVPTSAEPASKACSSPGGALCDTPVHPKQH